MKKIINKNEMGITLIALVITIIVLLILAGVAISMLSGENGILGQAVKAKMKTEKETAKEKIGIVLLGKIIEENVNKEEINISNLENELKRELNDDTVTVKVTDTEYIIRTENEEYNVNKASGKITTGIFNLPTAINDSFFNQVEIGYTYNSKSYTTNFDVASIKNVSSTTYYVSPTGNDSNDGLTKEKPLKSLSTIISKYNSGDTIILLEGMYSLDNWTTSSQYWRKSINIIGENSNVYVKQGYDYIYTKNSEFDNIYQAAEEKVSQVLDITDLSSGQIAKLTETTSISECNDRDSSYYADGTNVYINMKGNIVPTNENVIVNREERRSTYKHIKRCRKCKNVSRKFNNNRW